MSHNTSHNHPAGADPRKARSLASIRDAAIRCLLNNPQASFADIARVAGVGRATLYRHFPTRESLIQALAVDCLRESEEQLAPLLTAELGARDSIDASIDVLMATADRYRFLMSLWSMSDAPEINAIYMRQLAQLHALVRQAQADGDITRELTADWIVASFDGLLNAGWSMVEAGRMSSAEAAAGMRAVFFSGVQPTV